MRTYRIIILLILIGFVHSGFSQTDIQKDTLIELFTYKGIPLQNFYGKKVKEFIAEVKKGKDSISKSIGWYEPRGNIIGLRIIISDSTSSLMIYFKDTFMYRVPKDMPACDDKKVGNAVISRFAVRYRKGYVIDVAPKSAW